LSLLRASLTATLVTSIAIACSPSDGGVGASDDGGGGTSGAFPSGGGATPTGGMGGSATGGAGASGAGPTGGVSGTGLGGAAGTPTGGNSGTSGAAGTAGAPTGGSAGAATGGVGGDGMSGASGTGGGGTAGGGTGGSAGGSGAYTGTIIIQDNFDASAMVDAKWIRYPSFNMQQQPVIDTTRKHSGNNAVKATGNNVGSFLIPASGQLGGMIVPGNRFFVRVWVNFEKATSAIGNHSDFLVGATSQDNSGVELRLGFSSNQSGKPEMLDLNLIGSGAEVTRYSNGFTDGGNPGAFSGTGVQFVANQWYCIEALFDGAASEFRLWIDGAENMEMHVTDFSGNGTPRLNWAPMFTYLKVGTQDFSGQIGQVWYDDVFVGTAQVGCQR
jgi:hypothetical protein